MSDEEFGYEYDDDGGWSDPGEGEEENETDVLIINTFYEGEQKKDKNPKEAIENFETVMMLEEQNGKNDNTFKCLEYVTTLSCQLGDYKKALSSHQKLLKMVDQVARNDKQTAITNILEAVNNAEDTDFKSEVFDITLEVLKDSDRKMWMDIQIKLGRLCLQKEEYKRLDLLISELKDICTSGESSEKDNSNLMEVYCLEIELCAKINDNKRLRAIYPETEKLSTVINDPRVSGTIKEYGGKMFMGEKQWKRALDELFEAFKCYQEFANPKAKTILKYVILASIISNSEINYADTREAKVYQDDKEIAALMDLRVAYESNDYKDILKILKKIKKDEFMEKCLDDFMRNIRLNALIIKIKPYKNVQISYLSDELGVSEREVVTLLVELILDQRIYAKIDQKEGFLELYNAKKDVISKKKYQAVSGWLDSLSDLNSKIVLNKY